MSSLPFRRIASFVLLQGLSALVPLLVLPVINDRVGREGWVSLSIGYGIGAAAATPAAFGWAVLGPHRVAAATDETAAAVYLESVITRSVAWVISASVAACAAAALAPGEHVMLAVLMAVAISSWGLTPSWFFIGRGLPSRVAAYETIPRLVSSVAAIPAVSLLNAPLAYPILVLATSLATFCVVTVRLTAPLHGNLALPPEWRSRLRGHASLSFSALLGTGYTSLVVPIARLAHPGVSALSDIAVATRIRNMAQMGTASVTSGLQGWASQGDEVDLPRRRRKALLATSLAGVASALFLFLLLPPTAHLLFGDVASVSWTLSFLTALAAIPYAIGSSLSFHVLAPLAMTRTISLSRIAATIIGVPAIVVGAGLGGAEGVLMATCLAEWVVVLWQGYSVRGYLFPR
ncbi:hypothetical protein [Dermacoccus abyssi]|uniref:hypothetical protein n=1 Tax=Dermacoccus abyssi TaxID=322596 RepID=UPI002AD270E4|nr:hypothetical protein [Dermacoccus abyssi]